MKCICPNCDHEFEVEWVNETDTPIRRARRASGLTVEETAKKLDISYWTYQRLERGEVNPRLTTMRAASKLFGKSLDELFPPDPTTEPDEQSTE